MLVGTPAAAGFLPDNAGHALHAGASSRRQALGLVEALESRRFDSGVSTALANGSSSLSFRSAGQGSGFAAAPTAERGETATSTSSTLHAQPVPELLLLLSAVKPAVDQVDAHHAHIGWEQPAAQVQLQPSDDVSTARAAAAAAAAGCSLVYQVEIAPVIRSQSGAAKARTGASRPSAGTEWQQVYQGSARTCQVHGLKAGTAHLVRVSVAADSAAEAAEAVASAVIQGVQGAGDAARPVARAESVPSEAATFQTLPTVPSMPPPPSLASRERKALKLKWSAPEEPGGSDVGSLRYTLLCKPPPTELEAGTRTDAEGFVQVYGGEERSAKVAKLLPGLRYTFKLQAHNNIGDSMVSLCSTFTTQATVPSQPDPPIISSSTADSITLKWARPNDNGSPVSTYRLERDDGKGGADYQLVYAGPLMTAVANGLRYGLRYGFRLLAENDEGKSLWSACTYATTAPVVPGSPCNLLVVGVSRTSATLSWRAPEDDGGSRITGYEVQLHAKCRAATEHMGTEWLTIFQGDATACTISSLRAGCTYFARTRATSAVGSGMFSAATDVVTSPDVPDAPEPPFLGAVEATSLGVQWAPPSHSGGSKVTHYRLEVAQDWPCTCGTCPSPEASAPSIPGSPRSVASTVTMPPAALRPCQGAIQQSCIQMTTPGESCTANIRDLTPATGYFFRVAAANSLGVGAWSDWARMCTMAEVPLPPSGLRQGTERVPSSSGAPVVPAAASAPEAATVAVCVAWEPAVTRGAAVQQYCLDVASWHESGRGDRAEQYSSVYKGMACSCQVKGLLPAARYTFRVLAVSAVGSSAWSEGLVLQTPAAAPEPPQGLAAHAVASATGAESPLQAVELTWRPPCHDHGSAVVSYVVEASPALPSSAHVAHKASSSSASASGAAAPGGGMAGGRRGPNGAAAPVMQVSSASGWAHVALLPADEMRVLVAGLLPGRTYRFRVRASNAVGSSVAAGPVPVTTPAAPPQAPERLQVASRASTALRVRWEGPAEDNGSPVQQYELQAADAPVDQGQPVGRPGDELLWRPVYAGIDCQAKVTGLEPDRGYYLRCRACNTAGEGVWCPPLLAVTGLAPPGPPQSLTATAQALPPLLHGGGDKSGKAGEGYGLHLQWRAAGDSSHCATSIGFEVLVAAVPTAVSSDAGSGPVAAAVWNSPVAKVTVGRGVTDWQADGLLPGTTYVARVRAVGAEGSGHSAWSEEVVSVTPGQRAAARGSADGTAGQAGAPAGQHPSAKAGKGKRRAVAAAVIDTTPFADDCSVASTSSIPAGARKAVRKLAKSQTIAAAAAVPMATARPTRRGMIEQLWRKVWRAVSRHWWKVLLVWLLVWLVLWAVGALDD